MQNEGNFSGSTDFYINELLPHPASSTGLEAPADHKILIFSTENDSRLLLKTLLEIWGYQTEESDSPENSLFCVKNYKPNLILLDSILPFEANLENIRQIRKSKYSKRIPIIVLSGFSQPQFRGLSLAVGANRFFVKPVDFDLLENCLKNNLENHNGKTH